MKKDEVSERVIKIATHVADTGCTVREAAKCFNTSKSTVHKDLADRLKKENNRELLKEVLAVLQKNKNERHIRGGESTRKKHLGL